MFCTKCVKRLKDRKKNDDHSHMKSVATVLISSCSRHRLEFMIILMGFLFFLAEKHACEGYPDQHDKLCYWTSLALSSDLCSSLLRRLISLWCHSGLARSDLSRPLWLLSVYLLSFHKERCQPWPRAPWFFGEILRSQNLNTQACGHPMWNWTPSSMSALLEFLNCSLLVLIGSVVLEPLDENR